MAEEFNKYLSYVRSLGFEDTPDYDYLRDLFTQALKNTGEVEDGEYDWMKLNNGKGWEAMKQHNSHSHLHAANAAPNVSARALVGGNDTPRAPTTPGGLTTARLNAAQPPAPAPAKPGVGSKTRDRQGASGAVLPKRPNGAAGGPTDVVTSNVSTQPQFQGSTANLPQRISQINSNLNQQATAQQSSRQQNQEQQPSTAQKIMKALCCGR